MKLKYENCKGDIKLGNCKDDVNVDKKFLGVEWIYSPQQFLLPLKDPDLHFPYITLSIERRINIWWKIKKGSRILQS